MIETYYDRLKVPVDATENQIKMQYRRLAKGCHPDLNPNNPEATKQFRELHAAYVVLSDSEKRQAYDDSLSLPGKGRTETKNGNGYRYTHQPQPKVRVRRGPRRHMFMPDKPRSSFFNYEVQLSIQELFKGARRKLTIGQTHTCPRCRGKGVLSTGEKCPRCGGYTFLVSYEQAEILIPPGVLPGTQIRVEVNGDYATEALFDVLYIDHVLVTVEAKEDEQFSIGQQHLYITIKVPPTLLETGGKWELSAPEGGEVIINIPPHSVSGTVLTVRRHGLKNGASQRRGNLYCTLVAQE